MYNQKGKIFQAIGLLTLVFVAIMLIPNLSQAGLGFTASTPDIVTSKARMMEDALNLYRNSEKEGSQLQEVKDSSADCDSSDDIGFSGAPMLTPFRPGRVALW